MIIFINDNKLKYIIFNFLSDIVLNSLNKLDP